MVSIFQPLIRLLRTSLVKHLEGVEEDWQGGGWGLVLSSVLDDWGTCHPRKQNGRAGQEVGRWLSPALLFAPGVRTHRLVKWQLLKFVDDRDRVDVSRSRSHLCFACI